MKCTFKNWFTEEYGFFGDFYYISDNSNEGPYKKKSISRTERTTNEVNMIVEMLGIQPGASLFDCPCGWGRHSIGLAKRGVNVTAIDINCQYLGFLSKALDIETAEVQSKVTIVRSDMRKLSLQKQFDFGINMFSSFGFFNDEEDSLVARNFYDLLKPDGKMMLYLDFNAERLEKGLGFDYTSKRNILYNGKNYILDVEKEYHKDDKRLHGLWKLTDENGISSEKMYSFRIYSSKEMKELLQCAGFRTVEFFSSNQKKKRFDDIDTVIIAEK